MQFIFPKDGDVLIGQADGMLYPEGLKIVVQIFAPEDGAVSISGVQASLVGENIWQASLVLKPGANRLKVTNGDNTEEITVYSWPEAYHTYRFTVDDCIRCFENLHRNRTQYRSIFEDPYLAVFEQAHRLYGSCTHMNVFYRSCDGEFDLSMMTDQYREEFSANADWLSFSFHSLGEFPDRPYEKADGETVLEQERQVYQHLKRIVGTAACRDSTTIHWGSANREGVQALYQLGYRALNGYFVFCHGEPELNGSYVEGEPVVSYYLEPSQVAHLEKRCAWVDHRENMLFLKLHLVLNAADLTAEQVEPALDHLAQSPEASAMIQMVIHEQYFYPDYSAYEPDYAQRIWTMAHWMQSHDYRPMSLRIRN